jgi:nitroreductase
VPTPFDLAVTDALLTTTRAVRRRLDLSRPVEPERIVDCIRIAQQAPTASNTQAWRWVVLTDPGRRKAIGELYASGRAAMQNARSAVAARDTQTQRVYDSAEYLLDHIAEVPVHVIPCLEGRLPPGADDCATSSFYGSILPAVWSFQLALRSRGLGSVLTTLHPDRAAEILGIPSHVTQVGLLPVAYTVGTRFEPAARPPVEEIIHWNGWI